MEEPRVVEPHVSPAAGAPLQGTAPLRILMLEDLESDALLIQSNILKALPAVFMRVENKEAFLEQLMAFNPDLVLADYNLPRFSGLEALQLTKAHRRTLPFVLVTGTQTEEVAVECMKQGADDYILKSSLKRLPGAIQNILARQRARKGKLRARQRLRRSARQYRLLFKKNPHPMFVVDSTTLQFLDVNDAAIQHYGWSRHEFLKMDLTQIRPPEDVPGFLRLYKDLGQLSKAISTGTPLRHRCRDGRTILVEITANPIRFKGRQAGLILASDVTDRVSAEERLRASEEMNRRIIETVPGGIVLVSRTGAILQANAEAQRFLGLSYNEISKRFVADYTGETIHEDGSACAVEEYPVSKCLATGKPQPRLPIGVRRPDGQIYWGLFSATPVFEPGAKELSGAVVTFVDITERKSMEQALRASEERYRAFMEQSTEAISCFEFRQPLPLDLPEDRAVDHVYAHGYLGECNDAFARMYGYDSAATLAGVPLEKILLRSNSRNREVLAALIHSGGRLTEFESHETDEYGNDKYFLNNLVAIIEDGRIVRVWGTQRDVTERRIAESALRESEERFRQMADHIRQVFYVVSSDFSRILYISPAYREVWGRPVEELYKNTRAWMTSIHPDDFERVRASIERSFETGEHNLEFRIIRPDGTVRWLHDQAFHIRDSRGVSFRVVGAAEDITERKTAEQELARSLSLVQATLESTADGILVSNGMKIVIFNQRYIDMWGVPPETILDGERVIHHCMQLVKNPEANMRRFMEIQSHPELDTVDLIELKNGRTFERSSRPHRVNGVVSGRVWSFRDVTERLRADQERMAIERKLLETQKLESLGVLAGGIAHDFNNLLAAVLGNVSLLGMQMPGNSPLRPYLSSIETTTHRAAELCKQMLAYSGKGRFVVQPLSMNMLIQEMAELLRISIGKRVTLKFKLAPELPVISGDATQLRQVIMNLIINASEAIGPDKPGDITLSTGVLPLSRAELAGTYSAPGLNDGNYLFIEVSDTGCGMDSETRARIFDPFFTTKFTGRGLGLAAVLGIIRGHRGAITVNSAPGSGSTFRVILPTSAVQ
ncbi:MAG TPA: PAS domain S-box protein [Planctomycetota bacterium]|nr:PAS domain S-box protein [Planctomycetota bacterium]